MLLRIIGHTTRHLYIRRRALGAVIPGVALLEVVAGVVATKLSLDLDGEVQILIVFWLVLDGSLYGQPGFAIRVGADAKNNGSPVSDVGAVGAPVAGRIDGSTLHVEVVLRTGAFVHPLVVVLLVGARQRVGVTVLGVQWDGLAFGSCESVRCTLLMYIYERDDLPG